MTIESGTTSDRRNRVLIGCVVCFVFAGWFAYDGFVKYPARNLNWARQSLAKIDGLPSAESLQTNPLARMANLKRVTAGMEVSEVTAILGEPTYANGSDYCYIGPAGFGWFKVAAGQVARIEQVVESPEPAEQDIFLQKTIASVCLVIGILVLIHLIRVVTGRFILDETGLRVGRLHIPWDAMMELSAERYAEKGWVDLCYGDHSGSQVVRLDSYAIEAFKPIVGAICERKGFACPWSEDESSDQPDEL